MHILFSLLAIILGYVCSAISSCNLTIILAFDIRFIIKLFKTKYVISKPVMLASLLFSLIAHSAILIGGYVLSRIFDVGVYYCCSAIIVWLISICFTGQVHTQNMLTTFCRKHQFNLNHTLNVMAIIDDNGLIRNYRDILSLVEIESLLRP